MNAFSSKLTMQERSMTKIIAAVIALAVISAAVPSSAFDAKTFWEQTAHPK